MTQTIEQEAMALVNETITTEHFRVLPQYVDKVVLCRALEQLRAEREAHAATKAEYGAFRQEVSDTVEEAMSELVKVGDAATRAGLAYNYFARFLIPKPKPEPEPLVEVAREMVLLDGVVRTDNQKAAIREGRAANIASDDFYDRLRAALAARGLKLVEVGDA